MNFDYCFMESNVPATLQAFRDRLNKITTSESLESLRVDYLGRQGEINQLMKQLPELLPEERSQFGKDLNALKNELEELLETKKKNLLIASSSVAFFDPTEPAIKPNYGHLHLITHAIREINSIFEKIGFVRVRHPEIDSDYYAFESLNMPISHAARDEWETFYITLPTEHPSTMRDGVGDNIVVTPHTSNGQVREMEKGYLPIKMINIARCGRRQSDVSHGQTFHQFEGLYVDKDVSIAHLKGVLEYFARNFYGPDRQIRLRPYDFRFTEPSFEVDVTCGLCGGEGCSFCKGGWLELGGAGMVHPKVLKAGGINPKKYSGFAFGWGVERTYMMKAGLSIPDIRMLYKADLGFLEQF